MTVLFFRSVFISTILAMFSQNDYVGHSLAIADAIQAPEPSW